MRSGDLVKEKEWMVPSDLKARIGVIVRDDMSGLITVLWTGRDRPIVTDPDYVYVISNNGGS
jgi:hypothetical protein